MLATQLTLVLIAFICTCFANQIIPLDEMLDTVNIVTKPVIGSYIQAASPVAAYESIFCPGQVAPISATAIPSDLVFTEATTSGPVKTCKLSKGMTIDMLPAMLSTNIPNILRDKKFNGLLALIKDNGRLFFAWSQETKDLAAIQSILIPLRAHLKKLSKLKGLTDECRAKSKALIPNLIETCKKYFANDRAAMQRVLAMEQEFYRILQQDFAWVFSAEFATKANLVKVDIEKNGALVDQWNTAVEKYNNWRTSVDAIVTMLDTEIEPYLRTQLHLSLNKSDAPDREKDVDHAIKVMSNLVEQFEEEYNRLDKRHDLVLDDIQVNLLIEEYGSLYAYLLAMLNQIIFAFFQIDSVSNAFEHSRTSGIISVTAAICISVLDAILSAAFGFVLYRFVYTPDKKKFIFRPKFCPAR